MRSALDEQLHRHLGDVANRARLMLEVVDAVVDAWGRERVGIRLSPHAHGDGISDSNPAATFGYVASELNRRGIVKLMDARHPLLTGAVVPIDRKSVV